MNTNSVYPTEPGPDWIDWLESADPCGFPLGEDLF